MALGHFVGIISDPLEIDTNMIRYPGVVDSSNQCSQLALNMFYGPVGKKTDPAFHGDPVGYDREKITSMNDAHIDLSGIFVGFKKRIALSFGDQAILVIDEGVDDLGRFFHGAYPVALVAQMGLFTLDCDDELKRAPVGDVNIVIRRLADENPLARNPCLTKERAPAMPTSSSLVK